MWQAEVWKMLGPLALPQHFSGIFYILAPFLCSTPSSKVFALNTDTSCPKDCLINYDWPWSAGYAGPLPSHVQSTGDSWNLTAVLQCLHKYLGWMIFSCSRWTVLLQDRLCLNCNIGSHSCHLHLSSHLLQWPPGVPRVNLTHTPMPRVSLWVPPCIKYCASRNI